MVKVIALVNFLVACRYDLVFLWLLCKPPPDGFLLEVVSTQVIAHVEPHELVLVGALVFVFLVDEVGYMLQLVLLVHVVLNLPLLLEPVCVLHHIESVLAILISQIVCPNSFSLQGSFCQADSCLLLDHFSLPFLLFGKLFLPHLLEVEVAELGLHLGLLVLGGRVVAYVGIADSHCVYALQVLTA